MQASARLGVLTLIFITLIWGTTFAIVKDTVTVLSPAPLLALRFGLTALLFFWVRPKRATWKPGLILGLLLFAGFATQTLGLTTTGAAKGAFITGLSVILTPLFSAVFFRQHVGARSFAVAGLALLGLGLLSFTGGPSGLVVGDGWILLTAVSYALYIVYLGEVAAQHSIKELSAVQFWLIALLSALWALPQWRQITTLPPATWGAILYLAVLATALVTLLQTWAQRRVRAAVAALIFVLEPVFAALFAYLLLGETLSAQGWLGAGLIGVAMLFSELGGSSPKQGPGQGNLPAPPAP